MTDTASPRVSSPGIATVRVPAQESSGLDARLINQYRQRGWVLLENVVERADLDAAAARLSTLSSMGRSDRYSNSGRVDFTKIPNLVEERRSLSSVGVVSALGRRGGSAPRATRADISRRSHRQARARRRSFYLPSGFRILGRQAKCIVVRVDPISRRRDRRRLPVRDRIQPPQALSPRPLIR